MFRRCDRFLIPIWSSSDEASVIPANARNRGRMGTRVRWIPDCAGMAADLFETYAVTVVATMVLASIFFEGELQSAAMILPLAMGGACVVTSVVGTFFVRLGSGSN